MTKIPCEKFYIGKGIALMPRAKAGSMDLSVDRSVPTAKVDVTHKWGICAGEYTYRSPLDGRLVLFLHGIAQNL